MRSPQVFLLDEPLSNLDAKLRLSMRTEIGRLHRRLRATMLYVTHDQIEAMTLGQRIVVFNAGEIQQIDTPMNLYNEPANLFVAGFIGSPAMNFFRGQLAARPAVQGCCAEATLCRCPRRRRVCVTAAPSASSSSACDLRTCDWRAANGAGTDADSGAHIEATIESVEPVGNEIFLSVHYAGADRVCRVAAPAPAGTGPIGAVALSGRRNLQVLRCGSRYQAQLDGPALALAARAALY